MGFSGPNLEGHLRIWRPCPRLLGELGAPTLDLGRPCVDAKVGGLENPGGGGGGGLE